MIEKPIIMTIAGSDSGGGAGIGADLKTFAAFGAHGTCAITSVTAQNSTGVKASFNMSPAAVASQIEAICTDMDVRWAKTGMLAGPEIVREVAKQVRKYELSLVIDPVMAAEAGGELLRKEGLQGLREELLPLCKVTTPNAAEAGILAGLPVKTREDAKKAARKIADLGVEAVIVTGGHLDASDLLYEAAPDRFTVISGEFVEGGTHGTGCTYSSALTACLARGLSFKEAAGEAKRFVVEAIRHSMPVGRGVSPVNPLGAALERESRYKVLKDTRKALDFLEASPMFAELIPEGGSNIGMAISGAGAYEDVAAVEGRIVRYRGRARSVGCVEFGASRYVAGIILTALRYDPCIRAAVNIKFSEEVISACTGLDLSVFSFDRADEPEAGSMDWGIPEAIKVYGRVPDIIYDRGGLGKEPLVRVLGPSAMEVAKTVLRLAERVEATSFP
ncbi:MAG: bifunctional hydroxymethylpyrimidine kinase/phosphomethylpyrimidine kinase [Methanosarcinaceae archaeon]|nr:bifunctional hydroxymethylpyrimidine kinase/phosphomethylpyrimidine kinase [Methanosarcinaceae archaeon]